MLSQNNNALGIIFPNSYDNTVHRSFDSICAL